MQHKNQTDYFMLKEKAQLRQTNKPNLNYTPGVDTDRHDQSHRFPTSLSLPRLHRIESV